MAYYSLNVIYGKENLLCIVLGYDWTKLHQLLLSSHAPTYFGDYMCGARTRISSHYFISTLMILQGASKVLDASGTNIVLMFPMSGQFQEELTLLLMRLGRLKKLASNCSRDNIWHTNNSLEIMRSLLHKFKTFLTN